MLLVQLTIGGTTKYISNEVLAVEHFYEPYISSMSSVRFETRQIYGGYAEPTYGSIEIVPTAFVGNWPPPVTIPIKIMIAATGESDAVTLMNGEIRLNSIARDGITYDIYGIPYSQSLTYYGYYKTLDEIFADIITQTSLPVTLNTTYARSPSPEMRATLTDLTTAPSAIDFMSTLAEFFAHRFYIIDGVMYLVDCLADNGPVLALTESNVFPSKYTGGNTNIKVSTVISPVVEKIRLTIVSPQNQFENYCGITTMRLFYTGMESDTANNLFVTEGGVASGIYYSTYVPAYAFDNSVSTHWLAVSSSYSPYITPYVEFEFNTNSIQPLNTSLVYTINVNTTIGRAPGNWYVEIYDGWSGDWVTVDSHSDVDTLFSLGVPRTFQIEKTDHEIFVEGADYSSGGTVISLINYAEAFPYSAVTGYASDPYEALNHIKTIIERKRIEIVMPLDTVPRIGQKITLTDESLLQPTTIWARVSAIVYDFDKDQCVIEGEGELT